VRSPVAASWCSPAEPGPPRILVITDGRGDEERLLSICAAARRGGIHAVQVREPSWSARQIANTLEKLRAVFPPRDTLLFANDRADLVGAGLADGVQLGNRSLPVRLVRNLVGPDALIGYSAHEVDEVATTTTATADGADFILFAPVFATASKPGAPPAGVAALAAAVRRTAAPVLALGGVDPSRAADLSASGAAGVACIGAVFGARDPEAAARLMVATFSGLGKPRRLP
jgi:thiamine-phosphate diphosphorylase